MINQVRLPGLICDCGNSSTMNVTSVCHHCGKPLCPDCQYAIRDYAFANRAVALHCAACARWHHPVRYFLRIFNRGEVER